MSPPTSITLPVISAAAAAAAAAASSSSPRVDMLPGPAIAAERIERARVNAAPAAATAAATATGLRAVPPRRTNRSTAGVSAKAKTGKKAKKPTPNPASRTNYTTPECRHLMEMIWELQPICGPEWERVTSEHNKVYKTDRTVDSVKRKYQQMAQKRMSTGDPHCPDEVKFAKRAKRDILQKAMGSTGAEDLCYFSDNEEVVDSDDDIEAEDLVCVKLQHTGMPIMKQMRTPS